MIEEDEGEYSHVWAEGVIRAERRDAPTDDDEWVNGTSLRSATQDNPRIFSKISKNKSSQISKI